MKLHLNRNLQIGYGTAVLIMAIIGALSYTTLRNLISSDGAVKHSNEVIGKLESTISIMKDAETGQRGFLLTGNKKFLEPYNGAYEKAARLINQVEVLTTDNPEQQHNITSLRSVLTNRLNILQLLIAKKNRGEAVTLADLNSSKVAMDALRAAVNKAEYDEYQLLEQRTARLNRYISLTPPIILFAIALAIVIAIYSYFNVTKDVKEKDRLQQELAIREQETAAINEELTAANEEITAANEELTAINEELYQARNELAELNRSLEERVEQRTKALMDSEEETQALNEELTAINEELAAANEEMLATNEELSRNREELQKSVALFKSIAVNIPKSLIMVIGQDQRFIAVEGDLKEQLGFTGQDYVGKYPSEVIPSERYATVGHLYERVLSGEQFTQERRGSNGNDFRVDFVPLRNEHNKVYAGLIIAIDISDIKQAEERSAKLAAIVESSDDAIISKTLDGVITSWNRSAERLFGYHETEIIGQSISKLIPEDRQDEEPQIINRLKNGERMSQFETLRVTKEGDLLDVSLTISPVKDSQGQVIGISKIVRDISEKKRDEIRKNDFIGMVSHELKTPLTSLTALIQAANMKLKSSEDRFLAGAMDKANIQARKMAGMINGFLNISRLESSKIQIDKEEFDLENLLASTINDTKLTVSSHHIEFVQGPPVMVNADQDKIASVISNLLTNAVKYSPKETTILVKSEVTPRGAQVSVTDHGMGIRPEDQAKLFERFYRVESEHTRHISGFGIGLYLSREIIQRHNGQIWMESEWGRGSTFYFTLPLA